MVALTAVRAGREVVGAMVSEPPGTLKEMVQGCAQTPELASRMAWRSEPVPLSAFVITTRAEEPVTAAEAEAALSAALASDSVSVAWAMVIAVPPALAVAV